MSTPSSLRQMASLQAQVRFGPQQRALQQLLANSAYNYALTGGQARGTANALVAAAKAARPQVLAGYQQAAGFRTRAATQVANTLAGLGAGADPVRAAIANDQGLAAQLGANSQAADLADLQRRQVSAREGAAFAVTNANTQYLRDAAQIGQQIAGLSGDKGAFEAATIGALQQAEAQQRTQIRRAEISAGGTVKAARVRAAGTVAAAGVRASAAAHKPGKPRVTSPQQGQALSQLHLAVSYINRLKGHVGSSAIRQMLEQGFQAPSVPSVSTVGGKQVVTHTPGQKVPQIKSAGPISNHDLINAAFDIATFGTLSSPNRHALRGVQIPAAWRRPVPRRAAPRRPSTTQIIRGTGIPL